MTSAPQTPAGTVPPKTASHRRTRSQRMWAALKDAPPSAWFGMIVVLLYIFVAVFAPWIAPFPESEATGSAFEPWSSEHWLGTDQIGRDLLTRLIYGARNTIGIAFVTTLLAFAIGGILGILASIIRGWFDQVLGRSVDVLMAIPQLIFALMLLSIFGPSTVNIILIIAVLDSTRVFRLTRAVAINVAVMDYVEAARLCGEGLGCIVLIQDTLVQLLQSAWLI